MQARGYAAMDDLTDAPMSFAFGTANLVSTVDDIQRFARALFTGDVLQAETREIMLTFVNGKGQYNMPTLEYGLGVMRNQLAVGPGPDGQPRPAETRTVIGHTGGFAGFRSVVWWAPESGITIALGLNQSDTDPNILATAAFDAILTHQGR
jgi:D-alanyl-D-alanine carboxypeptidase